MSGIIRNSQECSVLCYRWDVISFRFFRGKCFFFSFLLFCSRVYSCTCCVSHVLSCSFADTDQLLIAVGISSCLGCTQRYNSKSFNICGSCGISLLLDLKINSCFEMQIPMCTKDLWIREYPFFRWFRWGAVFIQRLGDFCGETVVICDAGFLPAKHSELRIMSNQRFCITIAHMVFES